MLNVVRTPLSTKKETIASYKEMGFDVVGDKLIIPKKARTLHFIDKKGFLNVRARVGEGFITRVILPIKYVNLAQWIDDASRAKELERLKSPKERWGFSFFGNNSHITFSNIAEMLERFRYYLSVDTAIEKGNASEMGELFRNLEIVRIQRPIDDYWEANTGTKGGGDARVERGITEARFKRDYFRGGSRQKRARDRMKLHKPEKHARLLELEAAKKRAYRATIKEQPLRYKNYLRKERLRWKKRHLKR